METLNSSRDNTSEQPIENPILEQVKNEVLLLTLNRSWNKKEKRKFRQYKKKKKKYSQQVPRIDKPKTNYCKGWREILGNWRTTNTEHLNPRSRGGSNHRLNLKESNTQEHNDKHRYLGNKVLHEQLQQIMWDNFSVMHQETRDTIVKAVNHILDYFLKKWKLYNPVTFKHPHFIPKK